jgi:hypothetical protein
MYDYYYVIAAGYFRKEKQVVCIDKQLAYEEQMRMCDEFV